MIISIYISLNAVYFIVWMGAFAYVDINENIKEKMLKIKKAFIISILPMQYSILNCDEINNIGKAILIIVLSIVTLPFTLMVFVTIGFMLLCKLLAYGFMKIFGTSKPQRSEWWG